MRRILILFLIAPFLSIGSTITSTTTGGNWNATTTWVGGVVPTLVDTAIINTTGANTVVINGKYFIGGVYVNSGATLTSTSSIYSLGTYGVFTNNGTITGNNVYGMRRLAGTILKGSGSWSGYTGIMYIWGNTAIIDASVNITFGGQIVLDEIDRGGSVSVTNNGKIALTNATKGSITNNKTFGSCWTNAANSSIQVTVASWGKTYDTLHASAAGNTVIYSGTTSYIIKTPVDAYYNLTIAGTTAKTITADQIITNLLVNSGSTFGVGGHNIHMSGNWTNNGTITNNTGTVTFTGSGTQIIGGTTAATFKNLIETGTGTVQLGIGTTLSGNLTVSAGTFDCQTFQLVGNATGTLSLAAGTSLLLGTTGSATNVAFPTLFTTAHTTLNATSTVSYLANTSSQVILKTPTYGNLVISTGGAATKAPSGTPLTIAGNLTINANATLGETTNTINLTGNATINSTGGLTYTTGTANITGTLTNTGSVTYTGTGVLAVTGNTTNNAGGTISVGSATFNEAGSITNNGTLSLSTGTVNLTGSLTNGGTVSYTGAGNMNIKGNLTNNSTFTAGTGKVTMNGTAAQSIGGTSTISFNDLVIASTSTVSLTHNQSFTDILTMTSGTLGGADTMTLVATSSKTASVAQVAAAAAITATFKMQVYVNRSTYGYGFWSSPAKSETLGDLNHSRSPNFFITDIGGIDGLNTSGNKSVYQYSEPTETYNAITTQSYTFTPGVGIMIYIRNSINTMAPSVFRSNGVPNVGNVNASVTYTAGAYAGHCEIGNPYPSSISWASFYADNSALLQSTFYTMNTSGTQLPFTSGNIAMNQGFAVNALSAGTVTFKETHKTATYAGYQAPEKSGNPSDEPNTITLTLSTDANDYSCPTIISFAPTNSKNYNPKEDAVYLNSPIPEVPILYTVSADNRNLILNRLPDADQSFDLPLTAIAPVSGNYTLTMSGLTKLTSYNCVSLLDKTTGQVLVNFETEPSYSFTISNAGDTKNYVLHFTTESCSSITAVANNTLTPDNVDVYSTSTGAIIGFHLTSTENALISVYNMLGEKVISDISTSAYQNTIPVNLANGQVYIVRIETSNGVIVKKLYH